MELGKKIKFMRTYLNLTQQELADRCELTKSYISLLENDKTSPSLETLDNILEVLGSNLKEFFSDSDDTRISFSKEDQYIKEFDGHTITWLVPTSQKLNMEPIMLDIEPQNQTEVDTPHEGEEFGYVVEGAVEIVYGTVRSKVKKGESFYIECGKPHYIKNNSNKPAKVIWVSCPPTF